MLELILPFMLVASAFVLSYLVLWKYFKSLSIIERGGIALPVSMLLFAWFFLGLSSFISVGFESAAITMIIFFAAVVVAFVSVKPKNILLQIRSFIVSNQLFCFFLAFFILCLSYLLSTHLLDPVGDLIKTGGYSWTDVRYHQMVIESFLNGPNKYFSFNNVHFPVLYGANWFYPFVPDSVSTALVALGASVRDSMIIPGVLLGFSFAALFYSFFLRFSKDKRVAVLAILLFLLVGGMQFTEFPKEVEASGLGVIGYLGHLNWDYEYTMTAPTHYFGENFLGENFVAQSSAKFAFPMLAGVFLLVWMGIGDSRLERRKLFLLAGVLIGLLPFVQGEALYSVAVVLGLVCILFADWSNIVEWFADWCFLGVPAVLLGVPQVLYFYHQASGWGFFHFSPIWGNAGFWGILWFLFKETGFLIPVALISWFLLEETQRKFCLSFLALFVVGTVFLFQPWNLDNMKLLYASYIGISLVVAVLLVKLWDRRFYPSRIVAFTLFVLLVLSGTLSLMGEIQSHTDLYSPQDVALGQWVLSQTSPNSVFLTGTGFNPIFSIGGRQILAGPTGWLWSQGYNFTSLIQDERLIYSGGPQALYLLHKYKVDYVQLSSVERNDFSANLTFFKSNFKLVFLTQNPEVEIYRVGFGNYS